MADVREDHDVCTKPRTPIDGKRNILITSALPYANNVPHLGNLIGCVLSADGFARFCRLRGHNAIYICGTDEYGTATETKAKKENCSPREICDKYHALHKEIYQWFGIGFDEFGRTSTPQQIEICQDIFKKVLENNWLSENTIQQLYCENCQSFLADRLVEGTCPGCNYESARGDQCNNSPEIRDTEHFFLELPLLKDKLEEYIGRTSENWSKNAVQITNGWLNEGLKSRCITRDLKFFYVWFDAPIGYISITSCYTSEWEKWWKNPENVELYQFLGKDNVPFHTVLFPSTLLGTGEEWTFMKNISVTEYLKYEGEKFSKSLGIGVFGNDAKDTGIPAEVWRYYLFSIRPEVSDTSFAWADLQAKVNGELNDKLGNFINRVLKFIDKPQGKGYNSIVPNVAPDAAESHSSTKILGEKVGKLVEKYVEAMEKVKLKKGLELAMEISAEGNAYITENEIWKLYKDDLATCSIVIRTSVGIVSILATLLEPFMPSFSDKVLKQLNISPEKQFSLVDGDIARARRPWDVVPGGHEIGKPEPLFKKLKDEAKFKAATARRERERERERERLTGQRSWMITIFNKKWKNSNMDKHLPVKELYAFVYCNSCNRLSLTKSDMLSHTVVQSEVPVETEICYRHRYNKMQFIYELGIAITLALSSLSYPFSIWKTQTQ
ncbi:methionine--tRNA ligase [Ranunculus cassubicifolius]